MKEVKFYCILWSFNKSCDLLESYIVLNKPKLINSRTIFVSTVIIVPVLTLIVYLSGLQSHRSLYLNSLISTTLLSLTFFIFITTGLYNGWKLKDSYGNFMKKFSRWKKPHTSTLDVPDLDFDSIEPVGCILSFLIWLILAVFGSIILWAIGAMVWAIILVIAGMLYWILFRAYRLIFMHSPRCKNNLAKSMGMALIYTILYNCWIYAIIFGAHYLQSVQSQTKNYFTSTYTAYQSKDYFPSSRHPYNYSTIVDIDR